MRNEVKKKKKKNCSSFLLKTSFLVPCSLKTRNEVSELRGTRKEVSELGGTRNDVSEHRGTRNEVGSLN